MEFKVPFRETVAKAKHAESRLKEFESPERSDECLEVRLLDPEGCNLGPLAQRNPVEHGGLWTKSEGSFRAAEEITCTPAVSRSLIQGPFLQSSTRTSSGSLMARHQNRKFPTSGIPYIGSL